MTDFSGYLCVVLENVIKFYNLEYFEDCIQGLGKESKKQLCGGWWECEYCLRQTDCWLLLRFKRGRVRMVVGDATFQRLVNIVEEQYYVI